MIGDIPKGAPLRCKRGRHTGQENGGTMVFTCSRCGGSFWQPHRDALRGAEAFGDRLIQQGRGEEALVYTRAEVRRVNRDG